MVGEDTLPKILKRNYEKWGDKEIAMRKKHFGIWQEYTWKDEYEKVKYFSLGLISLGLEREDKVSIIGENNPEWFWAMFATHAAGGIVTGIFADAIPSEVKYIVEHSNAKFVVAHDQEQVDKILEIKDEVSLVKKVIYWDPKGLRTYDDPILISFKKVMDLGRRYEESYPGVFEENIAEGKGDDIVNLFYTSGTTGLPKGAILSHYSLIHAASTYLGIFPSNEKDEYVSHFPAAWVGDTLFSTVPHLLAGVKLNFAEAPETIQADIREIGPHAIVYGPRQWESLVSMIQVKIADAGLLKRMFYRLFLPVGYKMADFRFQKKKPNLFWKTLRTLGEVLLFRPLRDNVGLRRNRIALTGSSALSLDTFRFWHAIGVNLRQVYASTEAGFISAHNADDVRYETLGVIPPGILVKISDEGEILVGGKGLFSGYYKSPEKTQEVLRDGWLHTGDAGYIDEQGHLIFIERMADLGELATGAKYAPQYIEGRLRFSPYIKDVIVFGGKERNYVGAIINIDFEMVGKWAEDHKIPYTTLVDLSQKEEVSDLILGDVKRVNKLIPEGARIEKFVCLHKEFDPDEAELTRTRKLRRGFIEEKYKEIIEAVYGDKEGINVEAGVKYRDGRTGTVRTLLKVRTVPEAAK